MFDEADRLKEIDSKLEKVEASINVVLAKVDEIGAKSDILIEDYLISKDANLMIILKDFTDEIGSIRNVELKHLVDKENRLLDERKALTNSHLSRQANQGNNMYFILLTY